MINKLINLPERSTNEINTLFMAKTPSEMSGHVVTGIMFKGGPDYYSAYFLHREDMLANGDTEEECLQNLKEMYQIIREKEDAGELPEYVDDGWHFEIPADWDYKKFTTTLPRI